jgi:hypothetical protein
MNTYEQFRWNCIENTVPALTRNEWKMAGEPSFEEYKNGKKEKSELKFFKLDAINDPESFDEN